MRPWRASTPVKFPVGLKFAGAVGAVAVGVLTVAVTAGIGLGQLQSDVERLISDDLASVRVVDDLVISVYLSEEAVLAEQAAAGPDRTPVTTLLDQLLLPRLTEQLRTAREWFAGNASATEHLNRVSRSLDDFVAQRSPEAAPGPPAGVAVPFDRMTTEVRAVRDDEYAATQRSAEEARDTYVATRQELVSATLASLLAALTVVLLLVRDLVPRLRAYAAFAADVAAGRQVRRLDPRGADELAHLGRALDDMSPEPTPPAVRRRTRPSSSTPPGHGGRRRSPRAGATTPATEPARQDLDHFKQINDRFGHAKGDEVLAAVGAALRSCLRASDFAGRFGGEELLVLLPETTAQEALALTERIRDMIASIRVQGVERAITVSIGVADLIQHGGDASGLLRQADRALYTVKATGRNRVVIAGADDPPVENGEVAVGVLGSSSEPA